jgi:hypothetical protein
MANKSEEYPSGRLDGEVLKSFYGITGEDGNFVYNRGHERIPDNWYTRNVLDDYTIPYLELDTIKMASEYPEFASIGGNTGTVNSFVGLDPADLTGGVYNAGTLLKGNNLFCYAMQLTTQEAPDIISGLFTDKDAAEDKLGSIINAESDSLGCPKLNNIDKDQFSKYPGYTQS